jgi:hypothetical protein
MDARTLRWASGKPSCSLGGEAKQRGNTAICYPENVVLDWIASQIGASNQVIEYHSGSHVVEAVQENRADRATPRSIETE